MEMTSQTPQTAPPLSPSEERTWAMLAHLSVLINLVTGVLGPVAALLIYLIYKDRSRYVAFQSMQSFIMQLVAWVGGGALIAVMWAVTGALIPVIIGLLCIPFAILFTIGLAILPLGAIVYGIIGAIQTSQGQNFRYWLVAEWTDSLLAQPEHTPAPASTPTPPTTPTPIEETPSDVV